LQDLSVVDGRRALGEREREREREIIVFRRRNGDLIELREGCKTGKSDMDVRDSKMMGDSGWLCHCHGMLECAAV
jgi:hypothetical protein